MHTYSDPTRENDTYALTDVEVFSVSPLEAAYNRMNADHGNEFTIYEAGWYFWYCFPGCLPDSEPYGPYATEAEAVAAAQDNE
jgi:hypothetical protein